MASHMHMHTHARARTHAHADMYVRTYARTRARAHTHTHTLSLNNIMMRNIASNLDSVQAFRHSRVRTRRICGVPRGRDAHNPHVRKPLCPVHPLMALFRTRAGIHRILREKRALEPWAMRAWDASVAMQQALHRLKHMRDLVLRLLVHPAVPLQHVRVRARQRVHAKPPSA